MAVPTGRSIDPRLLVVAAAVLWGTTGTARALGPDDAAPTAVGAARIVVGGGCLTLLGWRLGWLARPRSSRDAGWAPLIVAASAMAAYQPFFFGGVARTGVAVGTVVGIGSAPIFTGMLGMGVRGEHPGTRWWIATGLALAGTTLLVGAGSASDVDRLGVALALGAGASYALYVLASKLALDAGGSPDQVVAVVFGIAAALSLPLLVGAGIGPLVSWPGVVAIGHLALLTVVVAYLLFGRGLAGVGVGTAGTLTLAEPATAALLGIGLLDERLAATTAAGLALVAGGLVVLVATRGRHPEPEGLPVPDELGAP